MNKEEILLSFDISRSKIYGVFGSEIHIEGEFYSEEIEEMLDCIFVIPRKEYLRVWNIWLDDKRDYCERWDHYCGVMGYIHVVKFKEIRTIIVNEYNSSTEEYDEIPKRVFKVSKFDNVCDFEHG